MTTKEMTKAGKVNDGRCGICSDEVVGGPWVVTFEYGVIHRLCYAELRSDW